MGDWLRWRVNNLHLSIYTSTHIKNNPALLSYYSLISIYFSMANTLCLIRSVKVANRSSVIRLGKLQSQIGTLVSVCRQPSGAQAKWNTESENAICQNPRRNHNNILLTVNWGRTFKSKSKVIVYCGMCS